MNTGSRELRQLARELDELRRRLGRYDDRVETSELAELGASVRKISQELRNRAVVLEDDVVGHGSQRTNGA